MILSDQSLVSIYIDSLVSADAIAGMRLRCLDFGATSLPHTVRKI